MNDGTKLRAALDHLRSSFTNRAHADRTLLAADAAVVIERALSVCASGLCGLCGKQSLPRCLEGDLSYADGSYRVCPNWADKLAEEHKAPPASPESGSTGAPDDQIQKAVKP